MTNLDYCKNYSEISCDISTSVIHIPSCGFCHSNMLFKFLTQSTVLII